ncbi:MAG TPA: FAD-dependent oxidoreductase, partial [Steroidobacteraceae bacterium]|nr:FAD-dependent oxidoreductase [Steroidobacteraceae bacterium]
LDDQLYGREEVGGLMVGSLDDHAIPLSTAQLPQNFSFALLSERWPQFEPYMATAMKRFPLLETADVKMLLNGPESFTPDGQMLLGPIPGASGLFAACGFNSNGMALAPAAGRFTAEWIVEGAPSADTARLDPRRFSAVQSGEAYLRDRVTEIPGYHCRMHAADADYTTSRNVRLSPVHRELASAGARFGSVNAWERPLWVGDVGADWLAAVEAEVRAAAESVLLVDRSSDAKYVVTGDSPAEAAPLRQAASLERAASLGRATSLEQAASNVAAAELTALAGSFGQLEVLARTFQGPAGERFLLASPDQDARLAEWLRSAGLAARATDVTARYAMLELMGPRRAELLRGAGLAGGRTAGRAGGGIAGAGGLESLSSEDAVNDSTILLVPADAVAAVWRCLIEVGRSLGLRLGGHFAQEALRIARGVPGFGREATPARLVTELGSVLLIPLPREPAQSAAVPRTHRSRQLVAFSSPMDLLGFGGQEVVLQNGVPVGELTSRARLPGWPATLALALVDPSGWTGGPVETVAGGQRWVLTPRATAWSVARPSTAHSSIA